MQHIQKRYLWTLLVGLIATLSVRADGPWHVATNGVDDAGRDGLSWAQAWRTLNNAVARATTGTIYVSNGVYTLSEQVSVTKALTIEGVNGWEYTIVDGNNAVRCFHVNHKNAVLRGLTITNGNMVGVWDLALGGGVRLLSGLLDNCLIVNNKATFKGGGVYVGYGADVSGGQDHPRITSCVIRGNAAVQGGGVSLWGGGAAAYHLTIEDSVIVSNVAAGNGAGGGGIHFQGSTLTVRNSKIVGNEVVSTNGANSGAGLLVSMPTTWTSIENTEIADNVISNDVAIFGGGICLYGSNNRLRNCLIARNTAYWKNYGIAVRGGGLYIGTPNTTNRIESCTFAGNHAMSTWQDPNGSTPGGSAIYFNGDGQDVVTNCIVYGNTGFPDWFFGHADRTNRIHYTCSSIPLGGAGNLVADPQYVDPAAENYRLRSTSPCLNAGINLPWMAAALDLDGNPRVDRLYKTPDMGCYERLYRGSVLLVR